MLLHTSLSSFSKLAVTPGQCFPSHCFQSEQDTDRWSASRLSKEMWTAVDQPPWYGHAIDDRTHHVPTALSLKAERFRMSERLWTISILVLISGSLVAMSQANNVFGETDRTSYHLFIRIHFCFCSNGVAYWSEHDHVIRIIGRSCRVTSWTRP